MDTLRTLGLAVALGLSTAALAQTQSPPHQAGAQTTPPPASADPAPPTGSPDPDAASSPHQREATGAGPGSEAQPPKSPDPSAASSPHQRETLGASPGATAAEAPKLVGTQVVTSSGEQLGSVTDVMADSSTGTPIYVVVAPAPSAGGGAPMAIPYGTATSMMRNETLVVERAKLEGAPKVDVGKLKDPASTAWQTESDSYWGNTRAASKDPTKPTG